jgi:trehalose 6-phosphate synthase/phosphatase
VTVTERMNPTATTANGHDGSEPPGRRTAVVLASNRLPVRLELADERWIARPSSGGLAAALGGLDDISRWVGWSGASVESSAERTVAATLDRLRLTPVYFSEDEKRDFYDRVCNDTLWPLFHTFPDRMRISDEAWGTYVKVNDRFAARISEVAPVGARVWIHDFHLMLVPALLRRRRPDVLIGFFLHIPFPTFEVYRLLPPRRMILSGLLGADYVSFHTPDYAGHFRDACRRVLGLPHVGGAVRVDDTRTVAVGVDPIGIDSEGFQAALESPAGRREARILHERYGERRLVLGVERLDYTKGIPQKLHAFERFLDEDPQRAASTTLLQVLVPSRLESEEYRTLRTEIELHVARLNGRFGRPGLTPVEYIHRQLSRAELAALYRRADVMLVTPLRDGMNLVAHEFVFCQTAEGPGASHRGTLVLSELTGAAQVLPEATLVNPWDVMGVARALEDVQARGLGERRSALERMAVTVRDLDCRRWSARFLDRLELSADAASRT